jgi:predicted GNAT family acetyltransferase
VLVLRTRSPVRPLSLADRDDALGLCARDLPRSVFVAARILEGARTGSLGSVLGHRTDGELTSLCWSSANIVPVATTDESRPAFAERVRRWRGRCASVFGPREEVEGLWQHLEPHWGAPRAVRTRQPLLVAHEPPSALGVALDERVRPARHDEVDLVLPAAEHMFTAEIGYPPYSGSDRGYRASLSTLIARGHTYVVVEDGEVVFKTDVGSLALGCAQLQGVWLAPRLRGHGLAVSMLASVVEQVMLGPAPLVTLYVNDFNVPARSTYERLGFREVAEFSTVLL